MKKKGFIFLYILIGIFFLMFVYSLINILIWYQNTNKNNEIKEELEKSVIIINNEEEHKVVYSIDFNKLKKRNSDTIGYLKVPDTNINYVVVRGTNNSYYLNHNFDKNRNIAGWIFADYQNKFDGSDQNIIIYGHNTKDNSMFGSLNKVLTTKWQGDTNNHYITLMTEGSLATYRVFSTYSIKPEEYYLKTEFQNNEDYHEFINTLKKRSNFNYDVNLDDVTQILTLSSCMGSGAKRIVLHAALVEVVN